MAAMVITMVMMEVLVLVGKVMMVVVVMMAMEVL